MKSDTSICQLQEAPKLTFSLSPHNTMTYSTANAETWMIIDTFSTIEEAQEAIASYEAQDKEEGTYEPDWYEIIID